MIVQCFRTRSRGGMKTYEYFLVEGSLKSASFQMNVCLSAQCHNPSLSFVLLSLPSSADPAPQNSFSCSPFSSIPALPVPPSVPASLKCRIYSICKRLYWTASRERDPSKGTVSVSQQMNALITERSTPAGPKPKSTVAWPR